MLFTLLLTLLSTARCDADVRVTQDGHALVSRVTVTALGSRQVSIEPLANGGSLLIKVTGRGCNINYSIDVPIDSRLPRLTFEVADKQEMAVAR